MCVFFFKQKTAYEMRISDWSSDVCSSDLQLQFVESLDVIYTVLHDADMLGQSIRSVMQELQENKEFIQLVSDHDIHTMIKAIRNVMGVAKIRKEEKSSKRKTGGAKRTASSKFDADTLSQLEDRKSTRLNSSH